MYKLINALIKERRVTLFLALVISILGIYSYYVIPRQESPDVSAPIAMVITPYPGASPNDVKDLVTSKIEDELVEIDGYDESSGTSKEGLSIVTVQFKNNVDTDKAMQDVRNAVTDVQSELPSGVMQSQVNTDFLETAGIIISLSGDDYSYEQLASFGDLFKDKLVDIDGISKFSIEGEVDKEVKVDVDIAKLNQLGLSMADISQILQSQNIEIPSGNIDYGNSKVTVKTPGIYTSLNDIKNIIIGISPETGVVTKLSDVGNVYMDVEEGVEKYKQNGKNAVLLTGYFQQSKNVVIIGKDVRKAIEDVKNNLPEDLIVEEVVYQPDDVSKSTNDFMLNLVEGIILVVIVVFLGMGMRNAVVVSAAIPISILITFGVMKLTGIKIHQMSLTALIIALGVLVDNAIVISDTIQVKIDEGEEVITAAYNGTTISSMPIFVATLTTIAAFSPLIGLPGGAGEFLGAISQVLIISIIAAYIVAMFITPAMAATLFKKNKVKKQKKNILRKFFDNTLKIGLKNKKVTVIYAFVAFVVAVKILMPLLPSQFFPNTDKNLFYIDITSEVSGNIDATEKLTDDVTKVLAKEPEIKSTTVAVGNGLPKFYIAMNPAKPSTDYGQMVCKFDLGNKEQRRFKNNEEFVNHIQKLLDENIPNGKTTAKLLANASPSEAKVIVRVSGKNLDRVLEISNKLKSEIAKIPGTVNVRHDFKDRTFQFQIKVDREKASNLGISGYDIQMQINTALYGKDASIYRKDGNEYNIKLKSNIDSVAMLENLAIKSSVTGNKIYLKQFATIEYGTKFDGINTFNREQTIKVMANELPGYSPVEIENIIENEILLKLDTDGTKISFAGEREDINENFSVVGILAAFCIFIIYIILLIQFNSFMQPLVILATVPLSLIGAIVGLLMFKSPLSLTAFLGIIALIGLVVKNGILLIEYINDARKAGYTIDEACVDAVDKRFNSIILSASTTVMGLVPLAISGSALFGPMAISLMFGLTISTFLTMVVIPVIYSLVETYLEKRKLKIAQKTI